MDSGLKDKLFKQIFILIFRRILHSSLVQTNESYADLKISPQDQLDKLLRLDCLTKVFKWIIGSKVFCRLKLYI